MLVSSATLDFSFTYLSWLISLDAQSSLVSLKHLTTLYFVHTADTEKLSQQ